MDNKILFY